MRPEQSPILLLCFILVVAGMGLSTHGAVAEEDIKTLRVKNDMLDWPKTLKFRIRSQKSYTPRSPWRELWIKPGETKVIKLQSPDNYLAEVLIDKWTFNSRPMPLKRDLAKDPNQVLNISHLVSGDDDDEEPMPELQISLDPWPRTDDPPLNAEMEQRLIQLLKAKRAPAKKRQPKRRFRFLR